MPDRWIVTSHKFHQHRTREAAESERARLFQTVPGKTFRLLRIKTNLQPTRSVLADWMIERGYATGHGDTIEDMLGELEAQVRGRER